MTVERVHDFEDIIKRDTNLVGVLTMTALDCLREFCGMFGRGVSRKIRGRTPPIVYLYKVSNEAISKLKAQYNSNDSFVSTNDILCSWLFKLCESNDGLSLFVNPRGRVAELTKDMAGNYTTDCSIKMSMVDGPENFRVRWMDIMGKKLPADRVSCPNISNNWASFYHEVEL